MRRFVKVLAGLVGVIVVEAIVESVLMTWAFRSGNPRVIGWLTWYHKHVTNPVMVRFSGRSAHAALLHHVGRRSGKAYATPLTAQPVGGHHHRSAALRHGSRLVAQLAGRRSGCREARGPQCHRGRARGGSRRPRHAASSPFRGPHRPTARHQACSPAARRGTCRTNVRLTLAIYLASGFLLCGNA